MNESKAKKVKKRTKIKAKQHPKEQPMKWETKRTKNNWIKKELKKE